MGFACSLLRTDMAQHIVTANTREVCASASSPFALTKQLSSYPSVQVQGMKGAPDTDQYV